MAVGRYHIIIDVFDVDKETLVNVEELKEFISELAEQIQMEILFGPIVVEGVPANPGLTGFAIIDYSHISIHTFTDSNEALVDIFSCKPYEQESAISKTIEFFNIKREKAKIQIVSWK